MPCLVALAGCGGDQTPGPEPHKEIFPAAPDPNRDILSTALDVSLATLEASADITVAGSDSAAASFEAQGLEIIDVHGSDGPLEWEHVAGRLDVGVDPSADPVHIHVDYRFAVQTAFDGWLESGSTLLWPYHCGNLFPCRSTPKDGLRFTLDVHDDPEGRTILHPAAIAAEVPSYVAAWAVGDYAEIDLGSTPAGTELRAWFLPGGQAAAENGTEHLLAAFDYFEETLGPYTFGSDAGGISVEWGPGALGGMEHHPYWHVSSSSMGMPDVHVHEAAHGWFGDGVRIACWEDFVLSEGTVSYLTARAYEALLPPNAAAALWANYQARLDAAILTSNRVAWPEGCGEIDILDGYFSSIPYMKGAFFFRALENRIGVDALMEALASFYQARVGTAARMQELLDHIASASGYDPAACAEAWLREQAVPAMDTCP